jgi:predicted DNA-binding antitoxin AbrB/MazE fold protein
MTIAARYEDGVFRPLDDVTIEEGTIVEVRVPAEGEHANKRQSIQELPFMECGPSETTSRMA